MGERCCLGVGGCELGAGGCELGAADVRMVQDVEPFGIRRHQRVLDAVVHHLHEVAGADRAAVQIAHLFGRGITATAGSARRGTDTGRERREDRAQPVHRRFGPADHQAEPTVEPPHSAARTAVDVVDAAGEELLRSRDVIGVVAVAAVDDDVTRFEVRGHVVHHRAGHAGRHHQPHRARRGQLADQIFGRGRADGAFVHQSPDGGSVAVVHDALVTSAHRSPHEIGAHAPESDHPELHAAPAMPAARSSARARPQTGPRPQCRRDFRAQPRGSRIRGRAGR